MGSMHPTGMLSCFILSTLREFQPSKFQPTLSMLCEFQPMLIEFRLGEMLPVTHTSSK